jgi:DNA-binding CsgD family transcriptional regulator
VTSQILGLAADYRVGASGDAPNRAVEVVIGRERVARRTSDLAATVETELLVFDTPPYAADLEGEVARELVRLRRGVAIRAIYSAAALRTPERLGSVRTVVRHGEQARVLPSVPLKLAIFDRRTSVVPLTSTAEAVASVAVVHESGLLDALVALFETMWATAPRLDAPAAVESERSADAELLSLLASGVKDEAIARQLGVSVRTARRRITELMARLKATSRFQAGLEASRRGWLS